MDSVCDKSDAGSSCSSTDSDEALASLLGLPSFFIGSAVDTASPLSFSISSEAEEFYEELAQTYACTGIARLPCNISRSALESCTASATYSKDTLKCYENIPRSKYGNSPDDDNDDKNSNSGNSNGTNQHTLVRTLTRVEKFLTTGEWSDLSSVIIRAAERVTGMEGLRVFKEKLNYKPPGGKGFAPHLDGGHVRSRIDSSMQV